MIRRLRLDPSLAFPALVGAALAFAPAVARAEMPAGTWTLVMENDRFADTDRHYTHGTRIAWVSDKTGAGPGWVGNLLDRLYPFADMRAGRIGFALGQNIYTPEDISRPELTVADRPYAGWLYGAASVYAETRQNVLGRRLDVLDTVELQLGVIGPLSLAEPTQKTVHRLIDTNRPRGWDHQLDTEPGIALLAERKWRTPETKLGAGTVAFDVIPHLGAALGNVYAHVNAGAMARIGHNLAFDYGPPHIQPALSGLEAIDSQGAFGWYLFAGIEGRAVGRNIFLDGNTFSDSHSVDKHALVGDFQIGAAIVSGRWRLAYTHVIRTREFEGQDEADRFGAVSLSARF
ncbi:MAG: lipid A deacylase LpxR family protein [Rhodospirillales bacterium]|nr:lipid A deacylase LpxR family protein [Rhodospirillales bacterium]